MTCKNILHAWSYDATFLYTLVYSWIMLHLESKKVSIVEESKLLRISEDITKSNCFECTGSSIPMLSDEP